MATVFFIQEDAIKYKDSLARLVVEMFGYEAKEKADRSTLVGF